MRARMALVSRLVAAALGGYGLAAMTSVAALALPLARTEAVLTGMLLGFAVFAGAVVWVFAVKTAGRAWAGLLVAAGALLLPVAFAWTRAWA